MHRLIHASPDSCSEHSRGQGAGERLTAESSAGAAAGVELASPRLAAMAAASSGSALASTPAAARASARPGRSAVAEEEEAVEGPARE